MLSVVVEELGQLVGCWKFASQKRSARIVSGLVRGQKRWKRPVGGGVPSLPGRRGAPSLFGDGGSMPWTGPFLCGFEISATGRSRAFHWHNPASNSRRGRHSRQLKAQTVPPLEQAFSDIYRGIGNRHLKTCNLQDWDLATGRPPHDTRLALACIFSSEQLLLASPGMGPPLRCTPSFSLGKRQTGSFLPGL